MLDDFVAGRVWSKSASSAEVSHVEYSGHTIRVRIFDNDLGASDGVTHTSGPVVSLLESVGWSLWINQHWRLRTGCHIPLFAFICSIILLFSS